MLIILAMTNLCGASITVTSFISQSADRWIYQYSFDPEEFTKKDISNVEFDFCPTVTIFNHDSNVKYKAESDLGYFKFDSISFEDLQPKTVWFSFESLNPPTVGNLFIKAGKDVFTDEVYVPACVPEVDTTMLGLLATVLLIIRRNR